MPRVNIPGVGEVDFPDTMSEDEISSAAQRLHAESAAPVASGGEESGIGGLLAGGAAALGAGALGYLARKKIGPTLDVLNNVRRQGMLTGQALSKSLSGNLGAGVMESVERGSTEPLKEMLRLPTNVKNAVAAFKRGTSYQGQPSAWWQLPGRVLGATDEAAQAALVRGGLSSDDAARATLQSEVDLGPRVRKALASRGGQYFMPFQRTVINQGVEGIETIHDWKGAGKTAANLASLGAGFATGAGTDPDSIAPVAYGTAFMGRRGAPFAISALLGRLAQGASGRQAAEATQGLSPVSDYSISEGVAGPFTNPLKTFKPALWRLLFEDK